jgi:Amt family ammonium transporter
VGGVVGLLVAGFFATADANPNLNTNLAALLGKSLWLEQMKGILVTLAWTTVGTAIIATIVKAVVGLRPTIETETEGLDLNEHGEEAYIFDAKT